MTPCSRAGCGLPPGPSGLLGAAEGVSYLVVTAIACWSVYSKVSVGHMKYYKLAFQSFVFLPILPTKKYSLIFSRTVVYLNFDDSFNDRRLAAQAETWS